MASKDDRKSIRAVRGIGSTALGTVVPDHSSRWTGDPKPITIPTQSRHFGVNNPYELIGVSNTTRTNATARQTLLNGSIAPRKTVRNINLKSHLSSKNSSRTKGKGRASAPSDSEHSASYEIIDVDAEHISTDDLDLIADPLPLTSTYFDQKTGPRKDESEGPIAGPSFIADGKNTRLLQVKHGEAELDRRSSSPIETFPEDAGEEKGIFKTTIPRSLILERVALLEEQGVFKSTKPGSKSLVLERVALFEAQLRRVPDAPTYDFRHKKLTLRMQPKGGNAGSRSPPQLGSSSLNRSPGRSSNTLTAPWSARLPISMLLIGVQQLPEYDTMVFQKDGLEITFESPSLSSRPIGPISTAHESFSELQHSDSHFIDPDTGPPILYLRSSENGYFGLWKSNFSGVFQPGHDKMGQVSVQFDTGSEKWDVNVYKTSMLKLGRHVKNQSQLRPGASRVLWRVLKGYIKYSFDTLYPSDAVANGGDEGKRRSLSFSKPVPESRVHDEIHEPEVAESSATKQHAEEPGRFRYTQNDGGMSSSRRKRVSPRLQKQDPVEVSEMEPPPKRQRTEGPKYLRRSARTQEKVPKNDLDELILVFPFGVPGAVNVTTSDLARLQPEEFLNDNLIEFGLKSWLKAFEATDPELASQTHVFNSFFYKKLNKRKYVLPTMAALKRQELKDDSVKEGYDSVRKWTSKIDIFSKKYIIIPINENLHWYLALIYEPEHILQPPPPSLTPHTTAVTRLQARESQMADDRSTPEAQHTPEVTQTEDSANEDTRDEVTSETEVERLAFATSCSVTTTKENSSTTSSAEDLKEELVKASSAEVTPGSPMRVDTDLPVAGVAEHFSKSATPKSAVDSGENAPIEIPDDSQPMVIAESEVMPARFYGKSFTNQKRKKMIRYSNGEPIIIDESHPNSQPRTKIFIMDSLGNRHPQAMKQLTKWLELEAMDKKKIENVTPAIAKSAPVPVQPNYCDCGLYILHFAATFMSDPPRYSEIIMTKDRPSMPERQADWKDESVATMRDELRNRILVFSDEWRQLRAAREEKQQQEVKAKEEDEDSDVAVIEHVKASGKKPKSSRSTRAKS